MGMSTSRTKRRSGSTEKRDICINAVKSLAVGRRVSLMLLGDLTQGCNPKAAQFEGDLLDQVRNAIEWLKPFANLADRIDGVPGTEFHAGPIGTTDRYIVQELGGTFGPAYRRTELGGRLIDWTHHCTMGGSDMTDSLSLLRAAKEMELTCRKRGERLPDVMVSGHVHRSRIVTADNGITVATAPCWQLPTMNIYKTKPRNAYPDIGILLYFTKQNKLGAVKWQPAMPEIEVVK